MSLFGAKPGGHLLYPWIGKVVLPKGQPNSLEICDKHERLYLSGLMCVDCMKANGLKQ